MQDDLTSSCQKGSLIWPPSEKVMALYPPLTSTGPRTLLDLKKTVNEMMENLNVFADEVTQVVRELGTESKWVVHSNSKPSLGHGRLSWTTNATANAVHLNHRLFRNYRLSE
ncbi:hypothetical protein D9758_018146 [Tetrapyrgos nigripes]|uniref:Uncharacterized protein n=1 Tax=Tetrapyrgos nigripes TaxID=182062 RepID=A0A8H5BCY0_9AGAR|nr:hypothetical protein D9758_018146 [Tetrapyrgos nigripes]